MGTQGLVTVQQEGKVVMKVVAGCDGNLAQRVADEIRSSWPMEPLDAYKLALSIGFGEKTDLVVITEFTICIEGETGNDEDWDIGPVYRKTFQQPRFNPRWERGTADHVVVIDV